MTDAIEPSRYGIRHEPAAIEAVATHLANGLSPAEIAAIEGMPGETSIGTMCEEHPHLASLRARERRSRAALMAREALSIIDEPIPLEAKNPSAEVSRAKNRADYRKWLAGCWDRDTYGDAPAVQVSVASNVVVAFERMVGRVQGEG
jgi:hypothetical protein